MIGPSRTGSALQVRQTPGNCSRPPALARTQMLQGKVAVVTGSSSGIGAAIARELASRGASVVINYPYASLERQGESILESLDTPGISVQADLSTVEGPKQLIDAAVKKYGRIDILVNNASVAIFKPLELATLDEWDRMVNLNGRGYFLTTQSALPHLSNPSRIINITSSDCRFPSPTHSIYTGTKGMQDAFTKVWAKELPPKYGCTVNSVIPGPTRTPALEGVLSSPQNYGFDAIQEMMSQTPQGKRLAEPEEIAYAVGMLCEEKARFINGIHVHVSGGLYID